jgi:inosose dehydratase
MFEDEIDYVMENSDPELISLAPDTAHIAAAGADPVKLIEKYKDRVKFIHLKDYKLGDEATASCWVGSGVPIMSCFPPLGKGTIDFSAVLKILESVNYDAPLCIELDMPPVSNVISAKDNYDYLLSLIEG